MPLLSTSLIRDWHAHVYFDATTRDAARTLRETIATALADRVAVGRFHEKPVGPHPMGSFQLAFDVGAVAEVVGWLALNRDGLDVLVHPNTGDALRDHRDAAMWVGRSHRLELSGLDD